MKKTLMGISTLEKIGLAIFKNTQNFFCGMLNGATWKSPDTYSLVLIWKRFG